jgi:hypothetical protein
MLRSSMLKRMDEETVSQLFILTQVGTQLCIARQVGGGAEGPVVGSTRVFGCLKNRGFNEFVVFDPSYRHHSKCASIDDRCGVREAARITAYEAKVDTMMVSQLMQEGTKTRHERDVLAAQLVELEKKSEGQASC